jgi:alkaline phosphatase D
VRRDRIGRVNPSSRLREALTLADYRAKYALYRSDASLRRMHARFPMVSIWDDHEVQDNYAGGAPGGGLDAAKRFSDRRRAAATQAFFEHMPLRVPKGLYRSLRFGRTVELIMLDERRYRADQPCGDVAGGPDCPERHQPRPFLGDAQMAFVKERLAASDAAWKVIGNEVPIMPVKIGANAYGGFDTWQGYVADREQLLSHIRDRQIRDVVFVTGDFHTFFAGDVRPGESANPADAVATEFVGGSITSSGFGETGYAGVIQGNDQNPATPPGILNALRQINPWVADADLDHHGYGLVEATPRGFDVRFRRVRTIKRRSTATLPDMRWTVQPGRPSILT